MLLLQLNHYIECPAERGGFAFSVNNVIFISVKVAVSIFRFCANNHYNMNKYNNSSRLVDSERSNDVQLKVNARNNKSD